MRFIEIDGVKCRVSTCWECPCFDSRCDMCNHPKHPYHPEYKYTANYAWDEDETFKEGCPLKKKVEMDPLNVVRCELTGQICRYSV